MLNVQKIIGFFSEASLLRRSFIFTAFAFFAVWAVLLTYIYADIKTNNATRPVLVKFGTALAKSLGPVTDAAQAVAVVSSTETWVNLRRRETGSRSGVFKFMLIDADRKILYCSTALKDLSAELINASQLPIDIHGVSHLVFHVESAGRMLIVAEPVRTDYEILTFNGKALLPYLLIAFPFVLLPVLLSVRLGLRPLAKLSKNIEARHTDELSPVNYTVVHQELKPLVHALDGLFLRLKKKVSAERAFVQDAAHELRTPMAVISAQAHVIAHAANAEDRIAAQGHLENAIKRASHLSSQLLCLAALDDASSDAFAKNDFFDIAQWIRSTMAEIAPSAANHGVELSLEAPDVMILKIDKTCIESVFNNLLDNAIRYVPRGGNVAVTLRDSEKDVFLSIQDDGKGIDEEEKSLIFERFFRGSGHDDVAGSGLGLAIVKQACLRMNATITTTVGLHEKGVGFDVQIPKN
jgi:two-component system, OmpR family, sensor histidine kinase QseC